MARTPKRRVFEIDPRDGGRWVFQRGRSQRAREVFNTKTAAEREGTRGGREVERSGGLARVRIKTEKGRIESERTYGKDPRKYKRL